MSALDEFNALVKAAKAERLWDLNLQFNEWMFGSAYGPYLPPKPLLGLRDLINPDVDNSGMDNPWWSQPVNMESTPLTRERLDAAQGAATPRWSAFP